MSRELIRERRDSDLSARRNGFRALDRVREALAGLQYGQVTVIVQDGVIIQVERTDRQRLTRPEGNARRKVQGEGVFVGAVHYEP
jgi:hypothetical protein